MDLDLLGRAYDLALLQTAAHYDLHSREDRAASQRWLYQLFGRLITRAMKPELVLELGAFSAEFSRAHRVQLPDAEFHAFEANPYNYERFRPRVEAAAVAYHHLAIGETVGTCRFNMARRRDGREIDPGRGNNSLRTKPADIEYEPVSVAMVSVDHFVAERGLQDRPTALWVDLEGCAYEGLCGAARTLENTQLIFVEVEDEAFWTGQKLSGDVRRLLMGAGFVPLARDFQTKRQYNMIYASAEAYEDAEVRLILATSLSKAGGRTRAGQAVSE